MNTLKKVGIAALSAIGSIAAFAQETSYQIPTDITNKMDELEDVAGVWAGKGAEFMAGLVVAGVAIYFLPRVIGWFKKMMNKLG